jgi:hypothetical protein
MANEGNQWWMRRSKHGRNLIFSSPTILWEAAVEYFEFTDSRKWIKEDWVGKDAMRVDRKTDTPYTISGLCVFLDCDQRTFLNYGTLKQYEDFFPVVTRIREIIFTQKFEGAATGAYNPMIIARDLHLRDNVDTTSKGEKIGTTVDLSHLSFDQLKELANESDKTSGEDSTS